MAAAVAAARLARLRLEDAWPLAISVLIWLPFIPGNIPNAFLLWQGPIEGIVWLTVLAGLLYSRERSAVAPEARRRTSALSDPDKAPWVAGVAAAALALFAFNQLRPVVPSGDEPHYLAATQSLISDLDLKVENNYARGDYLAYFNGRLQPHFLRRSAAGEIYSIHAPGVSVIVLPAFLIAGYAGAVMTVIALAGLTARLTWIVAWRLTKSHAAAWVGLAAVFVTAPFLFHTFTIYPDGVGALFVMIAMWLIVRLVDDEAPTRPQLIGAGAALAVLPWLHTRFAILAAIFGVIIVALLIRRGAREGGPRLAAFLAIPVIAAAAWFAYFWIIWGAPNPLAPYGRDTESSWSYIGRGLAGLVFDQQFGVLTTAPIYAMAITGMWAVFRQRTALALILLAVVIPYVVAVSTYAMWWGGTSAPARFVAALLPLAAIPIAFAWTSFTRLRIATLLLLVASAALVVPRLIEDGGRLVFMNRNAFDATLEWVSRNVDLALAVPSMHRDPHPSTVIVDALPWLLAIVILGAESIGAAITRLGRGAAWTAVAFSGAAMVMFAATLAWMFRDAQPVTRDRAMLASLHEQRSWHQMFFDVSRATGISHEDFFERMVLEVPAASNVALARLARVPAGDYVVAAADGSAAPAAVNVNRNDPLLASGATPLPLQLPVALSSLSVRTEGAPGMRIRPVSVMPPVNPDARDAIRAARYGRARVFFFDERAYPESQGFWTRGEGHSTVVIDADEAARQSGLPIAFTGGGAATTIGISVGEWSQSYSLTPGQRREITLPPLADARAWVVDIHSGPGFRPFEREPGNTDVRLLAAWFEIP